MGTDETRMVSETGGEKGQKLERPDLISVAPLRSLARHYGAGARKYSERNWEKGYQFSLSYGAAQRHMMAFWEGEDFEYDPETGTMMSHLDAAVFHMMALRQFTDNYDKYGRFDDRPVKVEDVEACDPPQSGGNTVGFVKAKEQAEEIRRLGGLQASRWEVP